MDLQKNQIEKNARIERVAQLWDSGLSAAEIVTKVGVTLDTVYRNLRYLAAHGDERLLRRPIKQRTPSNDDGISQALITEAGIRAAERTLREHGIRVTSRRIFDRTQRTVGVRFIDISLPRITILDGPPL